MTHLPLRHIFRYMTIGIVCLMLQACSLCSPLDQLDEQDASNNATSDFGTPDLGTSSDMQSGTSQMDMSQCNPNQSDEALCSQIKLVCGSLPVLDTCQNIRQLKCDLCPLGSYCDDSGQQGQCISCSSIDFCSRSDAECGVVKATPGSLMERCGLTEVGCGALCPDGKACDENNKCVCPFESDALLCGRLGKECGRLNATDQCGNSRNADCGQCPEGVCIADENRCSVCKPETNMQFCARLNRECGPLSANDNCDTPNTVNCGMCDPGKSCNAQGQCTCPAPTCPAGACGTVSNSCGQTIECGTCPQSGDSCVNNACVCQPETPLELCQNNMLECGTKQVTSRCGGPMVQAQCGNCPNNDTCTDNKCGCVGETNAQLRTQYCAGKTCGTFNVTDSCNRARTILCGTCQLPAVCQANGACCTPSSDQVLCAAQNLVCGTHMVTNNCGQMVEINCNSCMDDKNCVAQGTQCAFLPFPDTNNSFGHDVAIDNLLAVVGMPDGNPAQAQGLISIVSRPSKYGDFSMPTLLSGYAGATDNFGWAVDTFNGSIAVGAPRTNLGWVGVVKLIRQGVTGLLYNPAPSTTEHLRGYSLSMSDSNFPTSVLVGIPGERKNISMGGPIMYYDENGGYEAMHQSTMWQSSGGSVLPKPDLYGNQFYFGASVATSSKAAWVTVPGKNSGEVGAYTFASGIGRQANILPPASVGAGDRFGIRVAASQDGRYIAITEGAWDVTTRADMLTKYPAEQNHKVHIFFDPLGNNNQWMHQETLTASATNISFGYAIALDESGQKLFIGAPGEGQVHIYTRQGTNWSFSRKRGPSQVTTAKFGWSLDHDGRNLIVGGVGSAGGYAEIFEIP